MQPTTCQAIQPTTLVVGKSRQVGGQNLRNATKQIRGLKNKAYEIFVKKFAMFIKNR